MSAAGAGGCGPGPGPSAGPGSGASNPRKFSEKIALHTQRQAEETAAFQEVMMDITSTRVSHEGNGEKSRTKTRPVILRGVRREKKIAFIFNAYFVLFLFEMRH